METLDLNKLATDLALIRKAVCSTEDVCNKLKYLLDLMIVRVEDANDSPKKFDA